MLYIESSNENARTFNSLSHPVRAILERPSKFNCGGFALGTYDWYLPYDINNYDDELSIFFGDSTDEIESYFGVYRDDKEDFFNLMNEMAHACVDRMIDAFSNLRQIQNVNELKKGERLIAFRVGQSIWGGMDFHYRMRVNNVWFEKNGRLKVKRLYQPEKELLDNGRMWNNKYNSKIYLLAKRW